MANNEILTKKVAITKTNAQMVVITAVAAFVTVFCLVAAHAIWSQNAYQARVTNAKEKAHKQLLANISAYSSLQSSYENFVSTPKNVLGGSSTGFGNNDGNNGLIILDALPPSYDFPGLTSTIEKVMDTNGFKLSSISGTDDQLNQQSNTSSDNPQPVSMPFTFTVDSIGYTGVGQLMNLLQQSIRPLAVDTLNLSGSANDMTLTVTAHTYYQPSKNVSITQQVVK